MYIEEEVGLYIYSATTPSCIHFNDDTKLLKPVLTQEFYRPDWALRFCKDGWISEGIFQFCPFLKINDQN